MGFEIHDYFYNKVTGQVWRIINSPAIPDPKSRSQREPFEIEYVPLHYTTFSAIIEMSERELQDERYIRLGNSLDPETIREKVDDIRSGGVSYWARKCECGASSIGSPFHSDWCARYVKQE
jgi:hypothetical protein